MLNSIHCLRLPSSIRNAVGNIIQNGREGDLFYALMIANGQLVHLVRTKKHVLYPPDLHLLINFINSSMAFKSSEACLSPICLPLFNSSGLLHLYVCYLTPDICLILLSTKAEDFPQMTNCKEKIKTALQENNDILQQIEENIKLRLYCVEALGVSDLLHFVYKWHEKEQMTQPEFGPPYNTPKQQKRLFRLYQQIHHTMHMLGEDKPHKVYYYRSDTEVVIGWVTTSFDLYACFNPLVTKATAIKGCNLLLKWIKQEENNLFTLTSPVW